MTNAFDYKKRKSQIDWKPVDRSTKLSRSMTKFVESQRAKGIEPLRLDLNPNQHNLLLGRVEK